MAGNALNPKGRELPREVVLKSMREDTDPLRKFEVTVPELIRLVKRSTGRTFFVRAGWGVPTIDQNGVEPGKHRVAYISGNVSVPKREALKFINSAYEFHRDRVMAQVVFSNNCFFIGG
jgi:hypothetical protein